MAAVALKHGLNANLVHRWRRLAVGDVRASLAGDITPARFVPVAITAPAPSADIRIELRRGATAVTVSWPQSAVGQCGAWLCELLR